MRIGFTIKGNNSNNTSNGISKIEFDKDKNELKLIREDKSILSTKLNTKKYNPLLASISKKLSIKKEQLTTIVFDDVIEGSDIIQDNEGYKVLEEGKYFINIAIRFDKAIGGNKRIVLKVVKNNKDIVALVESSGLNSTVFNSITLTKILDFKENDTFKIKVFHNGNKTKKIINKGNSTTLDIIRIN